MPYPPPATAYSRSPPPHMQQYASMAPQPYGRPPQHSPVVSSPYQAPPLAPMVASPHHTPYAADSFPPAMKTLTPKLGEAPLVHSQPLPLSSPQHIQEPTPLPTPEQPEPVAQPPSPAAVQASTPGLLPVQRSADFVSSPKAEVEPRQAVSTTREPFIYPVSFTTSAYRTVRQR